MRFAVVYKRRLIPANSQFALCYNALPGIGRRFVRSVYVLLVGYHPVGIEFLYSLEHHLVASRFGRIAVRNHFRGKVAVFYVPCEHVVR